MPRNKKTFFGLILVAGLFVIVGIALLNKSHAVSPFVSINADQGSVVSPALVLPSSSTSSGKYVQFGAPSMGGNGTLTFDGTFSTTDPPSGPHWNNKYGTCYQYVALNQLSMRPQSSCSPDSNHLRTDICSSSSCSATSSNGQLYSKGVSSCTTVPFYLPSQIPTASGNSWYQIAEMKDNSSVAADWGIYIADSGISELSITGATSANPFNSIYSNHTPLTPAKWHTVSLCTNNNDIIYGAWLDGGRLTFNSGGCNTQTCTGLNLFYDGFNTQPLDINAYTGNTSGSDPYGGITVIHGDPLIATIGSNGLPPEPPGGWNSP